MPIPSYAIALGRITEATRILVSQCVVLCLPLPGVDVTCCHWFHATVVLSSEVSSWNCCFVQRLRVGESAGEERLDDVAVFVGAGGFHSGRQPFADLLGEVELDGAMNERRPFAGQHGEKREDAAGRGGFVEQGGDDVMGGQRQSVAVGCCSSAPQGVNDSAGNLYRAAVDGESR